MRKINKRELNRESPLVRIAQSLLTINIQRLLCTVIKFHVVKETKEAVPYFVQDF